MNKKLFILATLLVIFSWGFAHARTQKSAKDETTPTSSASNTPPTTHALKSRDVEPGVLNRSKSANSVVQDWNLVCKQLCGSGLGGPICGPQCTIIQLSQKENQPERVLSILKGNEDRICQDLCIFKLGGSACKCQQKFKSSLSEFSLNRDMVCRTFCENNALTLTGCSICKGIKEITTTTTEITTTTTTTTTTPKPPSTTTPNWEQVCVSLCKIGDGGALCNCDLPPFL